MPTNGLSFNSVPDAITQRAISHNFSLEEKQRREAMLLNKDFYYDKQEQSLELVNDDVDPATINLTKPIVKKRASLLYRKRLVREFDGPSESVAFLESVYEENSIDHLMSMADRMAELTGSAVILPVTNPSNPTKYPSGIRLRLWDSSQFSVVSKEEDPQEPEAISLVKEVTRLAPNSTAQAPQIERVLVQQVWTEEGVVTYNSRVINGSSPTELINSETNELGFLPFVNIKGEEVHDQYLGHAPATLIRKLNEVTNQTLTNLLYTIKMQGFTPIAVSGLQPGEGLIIHPGRAIPIPTDSEANVLNTQPKIEEMLETLKYLEEKAFETGSVPKVSVVGGEGESGRELLVRFFPLLQVFEDKTVMFQKYELDLANTILRMTGLPLLNNVSINFPEDNVLPLTAYDDTLERDIKLNIKTPIDELMRRDPDLSENEAQASVMANKDLNEQLQGAEQEDGRPQEGPNGEEEESPDNGRE